MSNWKTVKLSCLGTIITGTTPKTSNEEYYESDDIPFLKPSDFTNESINLEQTEFYISEKARNIARILPVDSVAVTCIGIIGKTKVLCFECAFNQQINAIIPTQENYSRYIAYAIAFQKESLQQKANSAVVPIINKTDFSKIEIPLPSLETQKQIAATLDKATHTIDLCNAILEKLDLLVKVRFVEMFGDPVENPYRLPLKTLPELGEFGRGVSKHRPRNAPELLGGKYPLIQTGDVANSSLYIYHHNSTYSEIGFKQSKMWKKGTLCITIAANIAKTAILTFDSCFPDSVVGFNANESTNNIFIHYWFSFFQTILEEQAPESAQKNINLKILSELKVIVPPIELQEQFAAFVAQTDKTKAAVQQVLSKAETLKKALMQEYFG